MTFKLSQKFKIISLHVGLMLGTFTILLITLFYIILPIITRHQQAISVPDLKGMTETTFKNILKQQGLNYQIGQEVSYCPQYAPAVVIEQHPQAGEYVKKRRRIYLTLNATQHTEVIMPNLIDGSPRNAYLILKGRGLLCDNIKYVPDITKGSVLGQYYEGQPIAAGEKIRQGSKIELVVGAGLSNSLAVVPSIIGKTSEEAELLLLDAGVCLGEVHHPEKNILDLAKSSITQQSPATGSEVALGTCVNIWVCPYQ